MSTDVHPYRVAWLAPTPRIKRAGVLVAFALLALMNVGMGIALLRRSIEIDDAALERGRLLAKLAEANQCPNENERWVLEQQIERLKRAPQIDSRPVPSCTCAAGDPLCAEMPGVTCINRSP